METCHLSQGYSELYIGLSQGCVAFTGDHIKYLFSHLSKLFTWHNSPQRFIEYF